MAARSWAVVPVASLTLLLLGGCGGGNTPAYVLLQNSIQQTVGKEYGEPPVGSVACTPHVGDVAYGQGVAHLSCIIRFKNGSTFATSATIEARSFQVSGYNFTFDSPPAKNAPTALPTPAVQRSPTAPESLFRSRNLARALKAVAAQFASNQLILSLAIYPGELEAVVGADGQAQLVTETATGAPKLGPLESFSGTLNGISISQLDPAVPERLTELIATRAGVPTSHLERFVLVFLPGGLVGWNIPTTGKTRFQAHLQGDSLEEISAKGSRPLS